MEVRNLLSQAVLETSGCGSKNLTPRRPDPVAAPITSPQQSKKVLQPVDTSSQASMEMAEASLEGIPTSISLIAAASRSESVTPPIDAMELWGIANKALEELLTTKASTDTHMQRAIWKLGIELHQKESQATESIKEAKAVCSWVTLDARTACSEVTLDAKTTCLAAVREAKTTQDHIIQEAKAACSTAIRDVKARGPPRLSHSKGSMVISCRIWRQVIKRGVEVKPTSSSPARLPYMPAHRSSRALWLPPTTFYWGRHLHHPHLSYCRGFPQWKNSPLQLFLPHQCPSSLLGSKDGTLPQTLWKVTFGQNHFEGDSRRTSQLQAVRDPTLGQSS